MLYIGIDFETHLISEAYPAPKPVCLSYYFLDSNKEVQADVLVKEKIETFLQKILESKDTILIAHNATFEMLVIYEWYPFLRKALKEKLGRGQIVCTQIYQVLADNALGRFNNNYALADLVKDYYNLELSKGDDTWRLRYADLEHIPVADWPKEAISYSIDDSKWCYKVYIEHQQAVMNIKPEVSIEASFYLNLAGNFGMKIAPERVNQLENEIQTILQPHYDALITGKFAEIKKGKFKKFNKVFGNLLKANLEEKYLIFTPKGGLKLTEEALSVYIANCEDTYTSSIITAFLAISEYEKVRTAFISRLKNTELIRTTYNSVVRSGRTSSRTSSIYPSVNIQQMPRKVENVTWDIRNCFVPRSGYVICSIDYSGLELASCAHRLGILTGKTDMRQLLNKGEEPTDLHSILGARIKSSKEGTPITADAFTLKKKESGYKEYRQLAKPVNLGFPGGIGYEVMRTTLAKEGINLGFKVLDKCKSEFPLLIRSKELRGKGYDVRVRQTKWNEFQLVYDELVGIKRQMFSIYPDLEYFLSEGHAKYLNGKTKMVKNDFGVWEKEELYDFSLDGFSRKNVTYTEFCNGTLMQSPSAIGAKKAFIATQKAFLDGDEVNVLAFIHDEILFEIKNNEHLVKNVERASEIMIDSMKETLYTVRIAVEAEVSNHWQKAGGFYTKAYWKDYNSTTLRSK